VAVVRRAPFFRHTKANVSLVMGSYLQIGSTRPSPCGGPPPKGDTNIASAPISRGENRFSLSMVCI
jgi:hypothetical protein